MPQLALLLYFILLLCLFTMDFRRNSEVSYALWIPLIWMLITGSRTVSQWLGMGFGTGSPDDYLEGNPLDRNIFTILFFIAAVILFKRKIIWSQILKSNVLLIVFFLYCGISIAWSDYPYVSLKRYTKEIGNILMVLIVLTEHDPREALITIFRRFAFVLTPLSIVLYKYFPNLGRVYHVHSGDLAFTGVATTKNGLGLVSFVCGLFFFWELLRMWRDKNVIDKKKTLINYLFTILALWLLIQSESMTSLMCFITGIIILLMMEVQFFRRNVNPLAVCFIFIVVIFQLAPNIMSFATVAIGRDPTLTGRTEIWQDVLNMVTNPLIGCGYDSFWLGGRIAWMWEKYWFHPTQAHSGYIEIYLTLGVIGLLLLMVIIISTFRNVSRELISNYEYASFKLTFLAVALLDYVTESTFMPGFPIYFIFMLIVVNVLPPVTISQSTEGI